MIKSKELPEDYILIKKISELTKIQEYDVEGYNRVIQGALVVGKLTEQGRPELNAYKEAAYNLCGYVAKVPSFGPQDEYRAFFCIASIDDHGISIFGPDETSDMAMERFKKLLDYFKSCYGVYRGIDLLNTECIQCGMYAEVW